MFKKLCMVIMLSASTIYARDEIKEIMQKTTEFSFMLKPRPSGDLGVFAAHDIAKGTEIFHKPFVVRMLKAADIPDEFRSYCLACNEEESACPQEFDRMEIGWYMNVSSTHANIAKKIDREYASTVELLEANTFYAMRDIEAGEEILINVEPVKEHFSN